MRSIIVGAVALAGAAALSACATNVPAASGTPGASAGVGAAPSPSATASRPSGSGSSGSGSSGSVAATETSAKLADVSELRRLGIDLDKSVLIDVADDGADHYLTIAKNGVVDFSGITRTDTTMMALKPAPGGARNQVVIKPPFWNEDLGKGSCVAQSSPTTLRLDTCVTGKSAQIWTLVPAGDSGQFELRGKYGVVRVDGGKIVGSSGRSGLQTILFAN